jgi:hypothetical protein
VIDVEKAERTDHTIESIIFVKQLFGVCLRKSEIAVLSSGRGDHGACKVDPLCFCASLRRRRSDFSSAAADVKETFAAQASEAIQDWTDRLICDAREVGVVCRCSIRPSGMFELLEALCHKTPPNLFNGEGAPPVGEVRPA